MIIRDLFSHKIHSSSDNWANKLIDLAFVFAEFDNKPYDRNALELRLSQISPRASNVARDVSKFRDEISAYPAYLGLYRLEIRNGIWHFVLSETANQYLVTEEPNVPAFMLLQLLLFQYPNGMGIAYYANSNSARVQANTKNRLLEFINSSIKLSPLRLICKAIEARAMINSQDIFNTSITYNEIFALANDFRINTEVNPSVSMTIEVLKEFDRGLIQAPKPYESRFHILKHTDFLIPNKSSIQLRKPVNYKDKEELERKFELINDLTISFDGFDNASNSEEILTPILNGSWGKYFDGIKTLQADAVEILTSEKGVFEKAVITENESEFGISQKQPPKIYAFRKRNQSEETYKTYSTPRQIVDPEVTRIKRQKSNLDHKIILQQLEEHLELLGSNPVENDHIDLYAQLPGKDKYLFEVKSTNNDNLLSQTRKGISQLYEYRYRYQDEIGYDIKLCLVYPKKPTEIDWLEEYVCKDREIGIIWFSKGELKYSKKCQNLIKSLLQ